MKPLLLDRQLNLLAYVGRGRVHPQEPAPPKTLEAIRLEGEGHQAAVTHSQADDCFLTFDLAHVRSAPPYAVAHKWWMSLTRARAISHALWFVREE